MTAEVELGTFQTSFAERDQGINIVAYCIDLMLIIIN